MFKKITRFIVGYARFLVIGESAGRFINLAVKKRIMFWDYNRNGEEYLLTVKPRDFKKLKQIHSQCRVKIRIVKKSGLPFLIKRLEKRPGLIVGILGSIAFYIFMSSQVWLLTVSGDGRYTRADILNAAENAGVAVGVAKDSFDPGMAAIEIMNELPLLDWVSVNTMGCSVEIAVKQIRQKPQIDDEKAVQDLIASKTGLIKAIEAPEGMIRVKVGEGVKKGDLLITGTWDSNDRKEEWLKTDIVDIFTANSRGRVMAEVQERITVSIEAEERVYQGGKSHNRYTFGFFGLQLPFVPTFVSSGEYKIETSQNNIWLLGKELPIYLRIDELTHQTVKVNVIKEKEAKIKLEKKMNNELSKILGEEGSVISSEKPQIQKTKKGYIMTQNYLCLGNIAVPHKVVLK